MVKGLAVTEYANVFTHTYRLNDMADWAFWAPKAMVAGLMDPLRPSCFLVSPGLTAGSNMNNNAKNL